jgi:hypothetical protein
MKLIVIFGPSAVGKMTVGLELSKLLDFKFFHNHMVIEPLNSLFGFQNSSMWKLVGEFRRRIFEEFSEIYVPGVIFTYVWALDQESDHRELLGYINSLGLTINDVLFVELEADQSIRINRNKSDFRLREKKSKNNIVESEQFIYESEKNYRLNSSGDFFYPENHIKINNSNIEAVEVARLIKSEYDRKYA